MAQFPGPIVPARPASSVLALRSAPVGFEVLMVRRAVTSEFMGNAHVFPGGSVEDADRGDLATRAVEWRGDPEELPWRAAALREFWEEAGVALTEPPGLEVQGSGAEAFESVLAVGGRFAGHRLFPITRWITPEGLPRRFDTRFYVADVGRESAGTRADGVEVFDDVWVDPETAIAREAAGEWEVPFPTMHHLELLRRHESVGSVIAYAGSLGEIPGVLPRVVLGENGAYAVLMPGDPGYDAEAAE